MKQTLRKHHKNLAALLIIILLCAVLIPAKTTGVLDFVEFRIYDLRINFFTRFFTRPRSQDITLVLLEQDCLEWGQRERGWGWPWPREAYAEFLNFMNYSGAESVIFDVLFTEPSLYRNPRQDEIIDSMNINLASLEAAVARGDSRTAIELFGELRDEVRTVGERVDDYFFAEALGNFERAVLAVFFATQTGSVHTWPEDLDMPLFNTEVFGRDIERFALRAEGRLPAVQLPIRELREAAAVLGSVTGSPDKDHIIRRTRLFTLFDGKAVPGLSAAAMLASGHDAELSFDSTRNLIRWGDFTIPVDADGKTLLRFRGNLYRYPVYQMSAVLQSAKDIAAGRTPLLFPEDFLGSHVFFGFYAPGLFDICSTPISSVYPGMGVHVTMLDNLLMGDFIQQVPLWVNILNIVAAVILIVILVLYSGRIVVTIAGLIAALAVIIVAGFWAFHAGWWVSLTAPVIAVLLAYLSSTLYSYATEGKDKRFIKGAFSRILSPKVIDQIIADPSHLKLGGERRKMTAIFTDVQKFSTIASVLQDQYGEDGPKVLVNMLNLYLTEMSNIVMENGGTIDKYEGDAIIAFFGAPVSMDDHAARACRSAIQIKKREKELKDIILDPNTEFSAAMNKLIESGVVPSDRPLFTRLGINSGDMVVGFMGTPDKMDYTIMGNAVNLTARLEGVNKQYNTGGILISEYTRDQIGDEFVVRRLSRVTVVGIPVPLRLYELLDLRGQAGAELLDMVELWEKAFDAYENKNFAAAKNLFEQVWQQNPADKPAKLYLDRCEKFIATPPAAGWDGVDNLTEK